MKNEEIICYCSNVTKDQIIKAMEQGARTLNDIRKMTGACTLHRCKRIKPKRDMMFFRYSRSDGRIYVRGKEERE